MKRSLAALLALCLLAAGCGGAADGGSAGDGGAAAYPRKGQTVQMIVGFSPGGTTDTWSRVLADALGKETGARFQVVNKPGAGTQIAQSYMLGQPKNGSTISVIGMPSGLNYVYTGEKAPFDRDDFLPVGALGYTPNTLVARTDSPYKSLQDVIKAAKAKPGKLNAAFDGAADDAVVYSQLKSTEGVTFNTVTFNGGSEKVQALMAGDVDFYCGALSGVMPQVKSGKFRVLAVFDEKRSTLVPDVPTAKEQGVEILSPNRFGITMSKGTPENIRKGLEDAMRKVSEDPAYAKRNESTFVERQFLGGPKFIEFWTEQENLVKTASKNFGI